MYRTNYYVAFAQIVCIAFVVFAFELIIQNSSVISPGGTLLSVLGLHSIYRLPVSIVGGLAILFILGSFVLYVAHKQKN